mmetsp:Transcript_75724/g.202585  ORF Transcript_75724/g.202585 Transcript_75724/m.202585 type:complete len:370 (+) Transcript_75724:45-1154(+)
MTIEGQQPEHCAGPGFGSPRVPHIPAKGEFSAAAADGKRNGSEQEIPSPPRKLRKLGTSGLLGRAQNDHTDATTVPVATPPTSGSGSQAGVQSDGDLDSSSDSGSVSDSSETSSSSSDSGSSESDSSTDSSSEGSDESSSSSSGSSSSSSSSSESPVKPVKKRAKPKRQVVKQGRSGVKKKATVAPKSKKKATRPKKSKARSGKSLKGGKRADVSEKDIPLGKVVTRTRGPKDELVDKVLRRWWYCMPDWPPGPGEFDYDGELRRRKLRKFDHYEFSLHPKVFDDGFVSVYELSQYPGVYMDDSGNRYDLRPRERCPCYNNLVAKPVAELKELLRTALEAQFKELQAVPTAPPPVLLAVKEEMKKAGCR